MRARFNPAVGPVAVKALIVGPNGMAWATLAVDTGSTHTAISEELVSVLGYSVTAETPRRTIVTISGTVELPQLVLTHVALDDQSATNFPVLVAKLEPDIEINGVLGLDFLRGRSLVVDFATGHLLID